MRDYIIVTPAEPPSWWLKKNGFPPNQTSKIDLTARAKHKSIALRIIGAIRSKRNG